MMKHVGLYIISAVMLCSCGASRHIAYFRDMQPDSAGIVAPAMEIRLQPYDKISIVVSSRDPKLSALFNLPVVSGSVAGGDTIGGRGLSVYTIDRAGNIDFPVMGTVHVAGQTRDGVAKMLKLRLAESKLLADAVVTVEFDNLTLSVLGEVNRPGNFMITRDCITVLDAIGMAGDLTRNGDRSKVMVVRQENGRRTAYRIDLSSGNSIYSSPAYYLRQNDVVYVTPR